MNALKKTLIALALSLATLTPAMLSSPASAQDEKPSEQLNAWANVLRANGEYQKLLSEAQLNYARAELMAAETAGQWQRVRHLKLLVDRAQLELRRLAQDEWKLRRKIEAIEDHARSAQVIMAGRVTHYQIQALQWLQINAVDPQVTFTAMTTPVGIIGNDEFSGSDSIESFMGENVGELTHFIKIRRLTVRPWGVAHQAIAMAVVVMASSAQEKLLTIRENLRELGDSVDPFTLPADGTKPKA